MALALDRSVTDTFSEDSGDAAAGIGTVYALRSSPKAGAGGRQIFSGSLDGPGDEDWVSLVLAGGIIALRIEAVGASPLPDPVVDFVDASGAPIAANSFFEQDTDTFKIFQFREPEDEDRFIRVYSASGTGTGDYTIDYAFVGSFRVGTELRNQPNLGSPVLYYALGGNDVITSGSELGDTIFGGDGNDTMVMGSGDDSLFGEAGDDVFRDNDGDNFISGGDGNDRIDTSGSTAGFDTLRGGAMAMTRCAPVGSTTRLPVATVRIAFGVALAKTCCFRTMPRDALCWTWKTKSATQAQRLAI